MRMGTVSALCALLSLIYFPSPAAGQSDSTVPQMSQAVPLNLPSPAKFLGLPGRAPSEAFGLRADLSNEPANTQRIDKIFQDFQRRPGTMGFKSPVGESECAHILIYQAPAVDSKMIKEVPKEFASNIPKVKGLQPCPGGFRGAMTAPQAAPYEDRGRIEGLAPASGVNHSDH